VREHGTFGLNRPWAQLADQCALVRYPMFGGALIVPPPWAEADPLRGTVVAPVIG
jgi:formamidase